MPVPDVPQFADEDEAPALAIPERGLGELRTEDLAAIERRPGRAQRETIDALEQGALLEARATLENERPVDTAPLGEIEQRATRGYSFVSQRPWIAVCIP
jgi:hypothetical protein